MKKNRSNADNTNTVKRLTIFLMSLFTAVALCVTGVVLSANKPVSVVQSTAGEVDSSGNYTNTTETDFVNKLVAGNTITYTTNKIFTARLGPGTYRFDLYGAQGGSYSNGNGGKGGHTQATYSITTTTTIYICVGGTTSSTAGGYNGGGTGRGQGKGGGGATHIGLQNALLKNTSTANVLAVAGGGGGAQSRAGGNGGGGNAAGSAGVKGYGNPGQGGAIWSTSNGGGAGGAGNSVNGSKGAYGQGGNAGTGTDNYGAGAGGGGYWGGGGGSGDYSVVDDSGGGGGSGYIKSGLTVGSCSSGAWTGGGKVIITAVTVNNNPTSKNAVISGGTRGSGKTVNIAASTVASDPNGHAVYFSAGSTSNLDTLPGNNAGLFINSTTLATNYFDWIWVNNTTLRITNIKKLPRAGLDGATVTGTTGRLPLYVWVRDSYGTTGTMRGYARVKFYLDVTLAAPQFRQNVTLNVSDSNEYNDVYVGVSKTNANPQNASATNVYNPNHTSSAPRNTAMIAKPLRLSTNLNDSSVCVNIKASDLVTGVVTTYDKAVIVLSNTSSIVQSNGNRVLAVDELDGRKTGKNVTMYNTSNSSVANAFTEITVRGVKTQATYITLPIQVYVVENSSARGANYQLNGTSPINIDLVFKVDNTRPKIANNASPGLVTLTPMRSQKITLSQFFSDVDNNAVSSSTHTIKSVVVPTNEYIQLGKYGQVVSALSGGKSYYNIVRSSALPTAADMKSARETGQLPNNPTGFNANFIATTPTADAYVQYSISGDSITFTGLRATYSRYTAGRKDARAATSGNANNTSIDTIGGLASTDCTANAGQNLGHFYVIINVTDKNDTSDAGIWLPIALQVNNIAPTDTSEERGQTGASYRPTAEGNVGQTFFFSPMGITVNRVTKPIGSYKGSDGNIIASPSLLQPLGSDADNYNTVSMVGADGKINELLTATTSAKDVQNSVSNNGNGAQGKYFTVDPLDIFIDASYFGGRVPASVGTTVTESGHSYVKIAGYKITLTNFTYNRYMNASVTLRDVSGATKTVYISVKVNNSAPKAADNIAVLDYDSNGRKVSSVYTAGDIPTITYNMPAGSTAVITPYDLLTDDDMTRNGVTYPDRGFTLNGLNGRLDGGVFTVGGTSGVPVTNLAISEDRVYDYTSPEYVTQLTRTLAQLNATQTFGATFTATNTFVTPEAKRLGVDRLYFERTNDSTNLDAYNFDPVNASFANPAVVNGDYASLFSGNRVVIGSNNYYIDFFVIRANTRTPAGTAYEATFTVRDRTGAGSAAYPGLKQIRVCVNVVNSNPSVKDANKVHTLSTENSSFNPKQIIFTANGNSETSTGILVDNEGDTPMFAVSRSYTVVDPSGKAADEAGNPYLGCYITVAITSDTMTVTALNSTQKLQYLRIKFCATDGRAAAEYSDLELRVFVYNAPLTANESELGFAVEEIAANRNEHVWTIDSVNRSDMTSTRYFVSNAAAANELSVRAVSDRQIKYMYTDSDALQNAVLSPKSDISASGAYKNAPSSSETDAADYESRLKAAVPIIGIRNISQYPSNAVGVVLDFAGPQDSVEEMYSKIGGSDSYISNDYDLLYFVDGEMYEAKKLIRDDDDTVITKREKFFDSRGRWIVTDWAIRITPAKAFIVDTYLNVQTLVRDETRFGGDSAGITTGYNESGNQIAVNGYQYLSYYLFVKDTSIVPYDYYDRFNGYYTVADGYDAERNYIPAYDASLGNQNYDYSGLDASIEIPGSLYYHAGNREVADFTSAPGTGTGYEIVKDRSQGAPTLYVGRLAGAEYTSAIGNNPDSPYLEGAFRYSHTINVSSSATEVTYVPMSYFALPSDLTNGMTNTGEVKYFEDSYVAYDIQNSYDRNNLSVVSSAITLSDGVHTWTGNSGAYALVNNPYVTFDTFSTAYEVDKNGVSNSPYLNKAVSITTYGEGNKAIQSAEGSNITYFSADNNNQMLIGNGHAMILHDNVNKLQEHQFGLTLKKSNARAAGSNLTMTVAVSKCRGTATNTSVSYSDDADRAKLTAVVSFKLEIGNAPVTLDAGSITPDTTVGYYTDVQITNGSSQSYEIELKKKGDDTTTAANKRTIFYNDDDLHDVAYFYPDSIRRFDTWSEGESAYGRVKEMTSSGFENCADSVPAQASLRHYFGDKTNSEIEQSDGTFTPNPGKYGTKTIHSEIIEGYSRYFSVSFANGNQSLVIRPLAKTLINSEAIGSSASMDQIRRFYAERGLVPRIESNRVVGAYYPLKVLIYDSCGDGFGAGSYVAVEVRVEVLDALPTFSGALVNDGAPVSGVQNKKLDISLAVGGTFSLNLKDYIVDPDMISTSSDSLIWKSTYDALLAKTGKTEDENFVLETSDYLVSPFVTDIGSAVYNNFTSYYERETAGDITMSIYHDDRTWTESSRPAPSSNSIVFTLNRRALGTSSYTFKLHFTDNVHYAGSSRYDFSVVPTLTVNVRVINQAPTVRSEYLENSVKMRAGDSFTVFTTPYDKFFDSGNPASMSSNSVVNFDRTANKNLADKSSGSYKYATYTSEYLESHGLSDYDTENPESQHLGYAAIADDDTPWTMRLSYNFASNYDASCFAIERQDRLAPENNMGGNNVPLTITVRAIGVCANVPLTFTVDDYEGGTATYTIYITVESSRPVAVTPETHNANEYTLNRGLSFTEANGVVVTGEYNMYMFAASDDTQVDEARSVILRDNTRVNAYGKLKVNIGSSTVNGVKVGGVAYDPDSNDNAAIGLYYSNENVPIFSMNGIPMTYDSSARSYGNGRYVVTPASDMRSFTITCLSYDFTRDWDNLQFYVKDAGNDTFDNALRITIHISTLYSSMTNKHMTTDKINNAGSITGIDEVYVKSYDRFSGKVASENDEDIGKQSRYQFMNYYGVGTGNLVSVDQIEGKSGAFIADSDVAATTEGLFAYDFRLYALMDEKDDESGYEALTVEKLNSSGMFTVDRANGYFYSDNIPNKYLIGGITHDSNNNISYIGAFDNGLLTYLQDYVIISVGADGLSLDFRPVSTNRDNRLLLYVQVNKNPNMSRLVAPRDAVLKAGSLFCLNVEDSAPMANTDEAALSFTGTVGSTATFKVYDHLDELSSIFTDSDTFDNVTVAGSGAYNDRQYREAFAEATRLGIDWDESKGKTRAIDISVDKARNEINITINRRIDMRDEDGKYLPAVTVPIVFEGRDMSDAAVNATLNITVLNSNIDVNGAAIGSFREADTGYGYSLVRDSAEGREYTLHAYVSRDLRPLSFNVRDIFSDPDFTTALSDTDSFRLVAVSGGNYDKYVTDDVHKVMYESDEASFELATVTPQFYNDDGYRFSGFTIAASSYARDHSAIAYMRVLDRCGDVNADDEASGITLKIVVEIINSAPSVLDGKGNTLMTVVGESAKSEDDDELDTITLDIADYVTDINTTDTPDQKGKTDTYLRIRFVAVDTPVNFFATKQGAPEIDDLATYKVSDNDDRILTITPRKGYFGEQVITVSVYDGNENNDSSLGVSFKIRLSLVYDFKEVDSLKQISSVRGIPIDVTTEMLVERKPDMAGTQVKNDGDETAVAALAAVDTGNYFNPAEGYVITSISAATSSVTEYVTIAHAEDGTWRLTPLRTTPGIMLAVEFSMPGSSTPYSTLQFMLTIDNNPAPVLKDAFRTDEGYVFNRYDTSGNREIIVLNQDGTANISPKQLFTDNVGDVVSFVSARSKSSSLASVNVIAEDNLALTFYARGSTEITVVAKDLTGDQATYTFIVVNTDLDEPTLWQKVMISYEANTVVWISILAAILLLIIILIIILIALRRRKKKQQELEEMLISEMELEEQMMRLNAAASATKYQSYGYLPPTMNVQNDPTLMLGSGNASQPQANSTPTLNLNAGQSSQSGNDPQQ